MALQADSPALRPAYWQLYDEAAEALHVGASLLQYWADGQHTVAEIADLVELEIGQPIGEVALRYFKLLAKAGLVEMTLDAWTIDDGRMAMVNGHIPSGGFVARRWSATHE